MTLGVFRLTGKQILEVALYKNSSELSQGSTNLGEDVCAENASAWAKMFACPKTSVSILHPQKVCVTDKNIYVF